ncbi:MAG: SMI1/KNR4 family protein [Terricaulis sp.]
MAIVFGDFDVSDFWKQSEYARKEYTDVAPDDLTIARLEAQLGYKLPPAYVELARVHNGGLPHNTCHRTRERTSWALDHAAVTGIYSIGDRKRCSLGSGMGSQFKIDEWGYPPIGVYFADCPSAGHDMICLDYRACGPRGEPQIVHIDQEFDYKITFVAPSFEAFIRGLEHEDAFPLDP